MGRVAFLAIAVFLCWPVMAGAADLVGRASVIDGDTIEIHGQRMFLFGIDAPDRRPTKRTECALPFGGSARFRTPLPFSRISNHFLGGRHAPDS